MSLRILIVRVGAMGDVLHALPAVAGLREALPGVEVGWVIEPRWKALLEASDGGKELVHRVHLADTRGWKRAPFTLETVRAIAGLRWEMRAERYDVCVDLQGSMRSAVIGWMAGAGRFLGPKRPREGLARRFYGERVEVHERNVIGQACEILGTAAGVTIAPGVVRIPVDAEEEAWCDEALASLGEGFVLIAPTAGWGAKEWGSKRFAELAHRLGAAGFRIVVNAPAGGDAEIAEAVARGSGATVVRSSMAQMIALTRRAGLVVGGDTGPLHLAAALRRPVVALFGPTDPQRNGPDFPGARVRVLRDAGSVTSHKRVAGTEAGLARIRVEEVFAASLDLLQQGQGRLDG